MARKKKVKKRWGLEQRTFAKNVQHYVDNVEYVEKLSEDEKDFLNKFNEEYYGNTFRSSGGGTFKVLHRKGSKLRKECYDAFNARQRDIYNQRLKSDMSSEYNTDTYGSEEAMIEYLDSKPAVKRKLAKLKEPKK